MAGAATLILGFMLAHHVTLQERLVENQYKGKADLMADIIQNGLVTVMVAGKGKDYAKFVQGLSAPDLAAVTLYSSDGRMISTSNPGMAGMELSAFYSVTRRKIVNAASCQACHALAGPVLAEIEVVVPRSAAMLQMQELWERDFMLYISAMIALALIGGAGFSALTGPQTRAMRDLIRAAKSGHMGARASLKGTDELSQLSRELDQFLFEMERSRIELERSHEESLEELRKMANLGELSSAMAHEIKNPLAGISGAIQVMAEDFGDEDPRREIVRDMLVEIERLDSAIRDLMLYARPPELHLVPTPLSGLVELAAGRIRAAATKQGIDVNIVIDSGCPAEVEVDPEQMSVALRNIMQRAMNRMPGGGRITLSASADRASRTATLRIADDGEPLDTSDPDEVFRPLFKGLQRGSGLGLAIARGIVRRHGFAISVQGGSRGAAFEIRMPARPMGGTGGNDK